jgi:hypothetical protein
MCEDFVPNFGFKRTSCYITTHRLTLLFSPGNCYPKSTRRPSPTHPTFHCFTDSRQGRHFDTIEVIEAELQAELNIITEHDFQDALKKYQKHWEQYICSEGHYLEGDGPKLVFDQIAATVLEIMDSYLYILSLLLHSEVLSKFTYVTSPRRSRDTSVDIMGYGLDSRGSFSSRAPYFFCPSQHLRRLCGPTRLQFTGHPL